MDELSENRCGFCWPVARSNCGEVDCADRAGERQ
jgi:hypothetical protein